MFKYCGILFIVDEPAINGIYPMCIVHAIPSGDSSITNENHLLSIVSYNSFYVPQMISEILNDEWIVTSEPSVKFKDGVPQEWILLYTMYPKTEFRKGLVEAISGTYPPKGIYDQLIDIVINDHPLSFILSWKAHFQSNLDGQLDVPEVYFICKICNIDIVEIKNSDIRLYQDLCTNIQRRVYFAISSVLGEALEVFIEWDYYAYVSYETNGMEISYRLMLRSINGARITRMTNSEIVIETKGYWEIGGSTIKSLCNNPSNYKFITLTEIYSSLFSNPENSVYIMPYATAQDVTYDMNTNEAIKCSILICRYIFSSGTYTSPYIAFNEECTIDIEGSDDPICVHTIKSKSDNISDTHVPYRMLISVPYTLDETKSNIEIDDLVLDELDHNFPGIIENGFILFNCRSEHRLYIQWNPNNNITQRAIDNQHIENMDKSIGITSENVRDTADENKSSDQPEISIVENTSNVQVEDPEKHDEHTSIQVYVDSFIKNFNKKKES